MACVKPPNPFPSPRAACWPITGTPKTSMTDLKQQLQHSVFYETTRNRLKSAPTTGELDTIAKAMVTPEFFALPKHMADELAFLHSLRHFTLSGAGA